MFGISPRHLVTVNPHDPTILPPKDGLFSAAVIFGHAGLVPIRWEKSAWFTSEGRLVSEHNIWHWEQRIKEASSYADIRVRNELLEEKIMLSLQQKNTL